MNDAPASRRGRRRGPRPGETYGFASLFKDSVIYGAGRALQKFLSMLLLPLYTQYLTPEDYGVLGMVLATATLVDVVITFGWDVTFSRFYFDDTSEDHRRRVITQTFYVDTVYPAIVLGALALNMSWISRLIMGADGYALYFNLALLNLFFVNITDLPFQLFRLDHKPWRFTTFTISRIFVQVPVTIVLVAVLEWGVKGVLVGTLVTSIALNIAALPYWVPRLKLSWDSGLLRAMASFAVASFFASIVFYVLNFSDRYLLRGLSGITDVGLYVAAGMMAQPVYFAGYAFRMAWPQWHYSFLRDPPTHKRRVARGYTYFTLMSAGLIAVIGVFLPLMIRVLLRNPDYWVVGSASLVLLFAVSAFNSYHLFLVGVNVTKRNRLVPLPVLAAAALSISLNVVLIPRYGFMAAAVTNLVSFTFLAALMRTLSQHYYAIPHEWSRVARSFLAAMLTLAGAYAIGRATGVSVSMPIGGLIAREALMALALAVFPLFLWVSGFFTPEEKSAIRRSLAGAAGRLRRLTRRPAAEPTSTAAGTLASTSAPPAALPAASEAIEADTAEPRIPSEADEARIVADLASGKASEDELAQEEERLDEAWETGLRGDDGAGA